MPMPALFYADVFRYRVQGIPTIVARHSDKPYQASARNIGCHIAGQHYGAIAYFVTLPFCHFATLSTFRDCRIWRKTIDYKLLYIIIYNNSYIPSTVCLEHLPLP